MVQTLGYFDRMLKLLHAVDKNNDQNLSFEEFALAFSQITGRNDLDDTQLYRQFHEMDKDDNGLIPCEVFCFHMIKKYPPTIETENQTVELKAHAQEIAQPNAALLSNTISSLKTTVQSMFSTTPNQQENRNRNLAPIQPKDIPNNSSKGTFIWKRKPFSNCSGNSPRISKKNELSSPSQPVPKELSESTKQFLARAAPVVRGDAVLKAEIQALERKLSLEQNERRKLETSVEVLRRQVIDLGGHVNDARVWKQRAGLESLQHVNVHIQERFHQERVRNNQLEMELKNLSERCKVSQNMFVVREP